MMHVRLTLGDRYFLALGFATLVSGLLLAAALFISRASAPLYLLWNLFLAWVPFVLAVWLSRLLRHKAWSSWEGLTLSAAWLAFLPNSFYMISDFIHLAEVSPDYLLFHAVLFTSFILTALALGIGSLYIVHAELRRRISGWAAWGWVLAILFVCSIAIYVGRDLRWNTWDVLVDPAGLLFDMSSRLLRPAEYLQMAGVVVPFFLLLTSLYTLAWYSNDTAHNERPSLPHHGRL
jgi:uncharacterized membrane protein